MSDEKIPHVDARVEEAVHTAVTLGIDAGNALASGLLPHTPELKHVVTGAVEHGVRQLLKLLGVPSHLTVVAGPNAESSGTIKT